MTATDDRAQLRRRSRSAVAVVFGVIAVVGVLASVLSVWAHRTLFDSSAVARSVDRALSEPEVVDALADHLTLQIFDAVDASTLVEDGLPDRLTPAAPLLEAGLRSLVNQGITRALTEEPVRRALVSSAEQSHRAVTRVLDGGRLVDGVTVEAGTASLNLLPLMGRALDLIEGTGLLRNVDLPDLDPSGDPATQIRELEAALRHPLPSDFGQLVIYDSETVASASTIVARAQQALVVFRRSVAVILVLTAVSVAATIAVATSRRRAMLLLLLGTVGAMGLGRAIIQAVVAAAPGLAVQPGARAAIRTVVTSMAEGLLAATAVAVATALALSILAFTTGPGSSARSTRSALRRNREVVSLLAFVAATATLTVAGFSLGPLMVVVVGGASLVVVAWQPDADVVVAATTGASPDAPDPRA